MFQRFPDVDVVVIDSALKGKERLAAWVKDHNMRIVCLTPSEVAEASWADETVNSHDPAALLKMLQEMGGRTDI